MQTIKEALTRLQTNNKEVFEQINETFIKDADRAIIDCAKAIISSKSNSDLSPLFAQIVQFCSDPELCDEFSNDDIERVYDSYLPVAEFNLNVFSDAAQFYSQVLNDKEKTKALVERSITKLTVALEEMKTYKDDL